MKTIVYGNRNAEVLRFLYGREAFADLDNALAFDPDNGMAIFIREVVSEEMSKRANFASHQPGDAGSGLGKGLGS